MKLIKLIIGFSFITFKVSAGPLVIQNYEKNIKNFSQIKSISDKIQRKDLELTLRQFVGDTRPARLVGTPGHARAQEIIRDFLNALKNPGSSLREQSFVFNVDQAQKDYRDEFQKEIVEKYTPKDEFYQKWLKVTEAMVKVAEKYRGKKGINFIFEKKGLKNPEEVIILGANYDTLVNNANTLLPEIDRPMPGADNNASGVVILLKMAEILNALDLPKTVRLVFFDGEEISYQGSRAYLNEFETELKKEKFLGFVNLLMLGHDSKRDDKNKKTGNMAIYLRPTSDLDLKLTDKIINGGKKTWPVLDFKPVANAMNASSHQSFWDRELPAIVMTQDWENDFNPRWHTSNDFVETLNLATWTNSFKYITGGLLGIVFQVEK